MKLNDTLLSFFGSVTGIVALSDISHITTIVTGISTIILAAITVVRVLIQLVDVVRKHVKGELTAEEAIEKLDHITKEGDNHDLQK